MKRHSLNSFRMYYSAVLGSAGLGSVSTDFEPLLLFLILFHLSLSPFSFLCKIVACYAKKLEKCINNINGTTNNAYVIACNKSVHLGILAISKVNWTTVVLPHFIVFPISTSQHGNNTSFAQQFVY